MKNYLRDAREFWSELSWFGKLTVFVPVCLWMASFNVTDWLLNTFEGYLPPVFKDGRK